MSLLPLTYSPRQVAESYGASVDTIRDWIASGKLTALNVGSGSVKPRWRIRPCDIEAFERSRLSKPATKPTRRRKQDPSITEFF